jgi:hypothetical protein
VIDARFAGPATLHIAAARDAARIRHEKAVALINSLSQQRAGASEELTQEIR